MNKDICSPLHKAREQPMSPVSESHVSNKEEMSLFAEKCRALTAADVALSRTFCGLGASKMLEV